MKTEDLIRTLGADLTLDRRVEHVLLAATGVGALAGAALFFLLYGPRPDLLTALGRAASLAKPALGLGLAAAALAALHRAARARDVGRGRRLALWAVPALALLTFAAAAVVAPTSDLGAAIVGGPGSLARCVVGVPVLSAPVFVGAIWALRGGANLDPRLSGALAGLLAGGFGVVAYGFSCIEDSPLFYTVWYSVGVAAMACLGWLIGTRALRL